MNFCPYCGSQIPDGANVCGVCGKLLSNSDKTVNLGSQARFSASADNSGNQFAAPPAAAQFGIQTSEQFGSGVSGQFSRPLTEKKSKTNKILAALVIVLSVLLIAGFLVVLFTYILKDSAEKKETEEKTGNIDFVIDAIKDNDWERIYNKLDSNSFFNRTEDEVKKRYKERVSNYNNYMTDVGGSDYSLSHKVLYTYEMTDAGVANRNDIFKKRNEQIKNRTGDYRDFSFVDGAVETEYKTISGQVEYGVEITLTRDGKKYTASLEVDLIKEGSTWKIGGVYMNEFSRADD